MREWPYLKVFLGELLGDKRFRGELRRTGHHLLTVLQGLWWEVRRGEGVVTMTPEELEDLADWLSVQPRQLYAVIRVLAGPKFSTERAGKKKAWLQVEGLPDDEAPTGPVTIEVTGWRERNNIAGRKRMDRYLERKAAGIVEQSPDPDDDAAENETPARTGSDPQCGEPYELEPVPAAPGPKAKPAKRKRMKEGRLYHIRLVRDPDSGECTWEGIDDEDRAEWAEKYASAGISVDDELEKIRSHAERKPAWYEERARGGAWVATIRMWLLNAKTDAMARAARNGGNGGAGAGRAFTDVRFRGDVASEARVKRLESLGATPHA